MRCAAPPFEAASKRPRRLLRTVRGDTQPSHQIAVAFGSSLSLPHALLASLSTALSLWLASSLQKCVRKLSEHRMCVRTPSGCKSHRD